MIGRRLLADVADLLLPSLCPGCRRSDGPGLCADCAATLPALDDPCPWCGAPRKVLDDACRNCDGRGLPHIARMVVRWRYGGLIERLVSDAKAGAQPAAARALAAVMPDLGLVAEPHAWVVPVPPSGRRDGPHLGTILARAVARRHGVPLRPVLRATRFAAAQHGLGAADRARNVDALFACAATRLPATVVLVDDLVTSGATASAAAGTLRRAGAGRIVLACLARTAGRG
jgi:predicted amidophosphoribosyltransferase